MGPSGPVRREPRVARIVAGVFLAALLLRLEYLRELFHSGLWDYLRLDPLYYHDWALRIARGELIGAGTYEMTPLYAYALSGLFGLFGHTLAAPRLLQAALGAATCALAALLGCRIFGWAEGLLAGLALAAYGPALFHDAQIMKTVLTVALTTATAAALYTSSGTRARWLAAGGALLGLTALCQENINVTLPFLLAWIAWRGRDGTWRARAARGALLVGAFAVVVAPATIRNYAVSGEFVLITSGGGEVFYTGNNEQASGRYQPPAFVRPDPFFEHEDFRAEAARRLGRPVTRRESDAFWWKEGMRYITGHPGQYVALLWDKLSTYLNTYERPDNYSYDNFAVFLPLLGLPLVRFGWIAALGIPGLALTASRWAELLPLHATLGCYFLSGLLFFTQDRYRMPMVPVLTVFAAHAAVALWRAARQRRWRRMGLCAAAVAGLALFVNRDPGNAEAFGIQNHGILGEMHLVAGSPVEAEAEFRTVLKRMENPGPALSAQEQRMLASAHYGIVLARELSGAGGSRGGATDDETIDHLRAAGSSPDADTRRDAFTRLGRILAARNDAEGAAAAYAEAIAADPGEGADGFERRLRLGEALHRAGRAGEALGVVEEALRAAPPGLSGQLLADAHYGEALIYLRDLPDRALAERHLREVLRLNPAHPRADWIRRTLASATATPEGP